MIKINIVFYLTRYPDELAWQINVTKKFIRKSSCMDKFHNFLVQETETVTCVLNETWEFVLFMFDLVTEAKVNFVCPFKSITNFI